MTWDKRDLLGQDVQPKRELPMDGESVGFPDDEMVPTENVMAMLAEDEETRSLSLTPPALKKRLNEMGIIFEEDWNKIRRRMFRGIKEI